MPLASLAINNHNKNQPRRDASAPLLKSEFLAWVENGLKIDLSGDVSIEEVGKALGAFEEQEDQQQQQRATGM